jgi:hypothetical protein
MPAYDGFPYELLSQPPEARLAYFAARVVPTRSLRRPI